jgi:hypothetical protein
MLEVNYSGIKYHRAIQKNITVQNTEPLKSNWDYSFVISFGQFEDVQYDWVSKNSCLIPLVGDFEALLARFSPGNRNQIRKFDRIDGFTFEAGISEVDMYYEFYASCEKERGWYPMPQSELLASTVFSVRAKGKLIAGMACYGDDDYFRVSRIYSSRRSGVGEVITNQQYASASKKIVFEICKFASRQNYYFVDLGGIDLTDSQKSGLAEFKMSFRPEVVPVQIGRFYKSGVKEKMKSILAEGIDIT